MVNVGNHRLGFRNIAVNLENGLRDVVTNIGNGSMRVSQ